VSVFVNIALTIVQVLAGIFSHSQSLIADGVHSLSDLISDFLVLIASYHSKSPADDSHPYGHGRIETAASLVLGAILVLTGVGIMYSAAMKLRILAICRQSPLWLYGRRDWHFLRKKDYFVTCLKWVNI
jgi:cation diffusion facilitator family transporter